MKSLVLLIVLLSFSSIAQPDIKKVEKEFIQILNDYRVSHGAPALQVSDAATRVAEFQNNYLAEINLSDPTTILLTHSHPDYKSFSQRVRTIMGDLEFLNAGENILALGCLESKFISYTAKDLALDFFNQWKDSPEHNENMLDSTYNYSGFTFTYIRTEHTTPNRMKQAFNEYGKIILVPTNDHPTYSISLFATNVFVNFPN